MACWVLVVAERLPCSAACWDFPNWTLALSRLMASIAARTLATCPRLRSLQSNTTKVTLSDQFVGFMRNGVILAEECPEQLMAMFNSPSLEDVLLQLSIDQEKHLTQTDQPRQIYFDNWDLARLSLLKNKVSAIIYIQRNFTDGIMGRIEYGLSAPEDFVNSSYMHVSLDNSDFIMYNILITQLRDLWLDFFVEVLKKCGLSEKNVPLPIKMENPVYGSPNSSFSESSVPGFLCGDNLAAGRVPQVLELLGVDISIGVLITDLHQPNQPQLLTL
uniref:Uncharacterized protein n=1 Tax=Rhodnius prolixus TaxID=13249 RepID=T1HBJ2_RHOPR